jgi:NAD(P)-dependent dehydrogenase (short-subunit alcohol dehydrogenase family)
MTHAEGKNSIIFGGSSGIGLATAELLIELGARVTAASNQPPLEFGNSSQLNWINCDVTRSEDIAAAVQESSKNEPIDWLVYSAGIQRYGSVVETSEKVWDEVQSVNVRGAFLACHFAIPQMRAGGAIVLVSSVQGVAVQQGVAAYAASKGALNTLTHSMALDHAAAGIRVNAVLPGTVDTPMVRASAEKFRGEDTTESMLSQWGAFHPLNRVAQPIEIARAIAFLLSEDASFITGCLLTADGGLLSQLSVKL